MSLDRIKHTSIKTPSDRLKESFGNLIFGLIVLLGGMYLLFWNEGRAIKRIRVLEEGKASLVELVDGVAPAAEDNGKLVYISALASSDQYLKDPLFNISFEGIALSRHVRMFQWSETKDTTTKEDSNGNEITTTTYSYDKDWRSSPRNSAQFMHSEGHNNPSMPYQGERFLAKQVDVNGLMLSESLVSMIANEKRVSLVDWETPEMFQGRAKILANEIYLGENPDQPKVGDMKVWFSSVDPCVVSVVAQLKDGKLNTYYMEEGKIEILKTGSFTSEELFTDAKQSNSLMTWGLRAAGFLLVLVGCGMFFSIFDVLAAFVPFIGSILRSGMGMIVFGISSCITLLTIAIGWVFFRPLWGYSLIGIALVFLLLPVLRKKKKA